MMGHIPIGRKPACQLQDAYGRGEVRLHVQGCLTLTMVALQCHLDRNGSCEIETIVVSVLHRRESDKFRVGLG